MVVRHSHQPPVFDLDAVRPSGDDETENNCRPRQSHPLSSQVTESDGRECELRWVLVDRGSHLVSGDRPIAGGEAVQSAQVPALDRQRHWDGQASLQTATRLSSPPARCAATDEIGRRCDSPGVVELESWQWSACFIVQSLLSSRSRAIVSRTARCSGSHDREGRSSSLSAHDHSTC